MSGKIYACDNCGFLFTRSGECEQCPDCGKRQVRLANSKEKDELLERLKEDTENKQSNAYIDKREKIAYNNYVLRFDLTPV